MELDQEEMTLGMFKLYMGWEGLVEETRKRCAGWESLSLGTRKWCVGEGASSGQGCIIDQFPREMLSLAVGVGMGRLMCREPMPGGHFPEM